MSLELPHDRRRHDTASIPKHAITLVRLTHILDLDGFILEDGFRCKEMALVEVGSGRLLFEHYRLDKPYEELSPRDKSNVKYVTNAVHGLPYANTKYDNLDQSQLLESVRFAICSGPYALEDVVVGYKGGNLERRLLDELQIQSVNMELLDCPRFNTLFDSLHHDKHLRTCYMNDTAAIQCPLHTNHRSGLHCAKHEVCMFRRWYLNKYLRI